MAVATASSTAVRPTRTTVALKLLMALTGIVLFGFVVAHMLGNLLLFSGKEALNGYAHTLHESARLLWTARIVLLLSFVAHIWAALKLTARNRAARPEGYAQRVWVRTKLSSRLMMVGGIVLLVYVVFHILHFTVGAIQADVIGDFVADDANRDVYGAVTAAFQNVGYVVIYVVAVLALAMHLSHGAQSFFQTLGLNHPRYNGFFRAFGPVMAVIVAVGFLAVPLAVLFGYGH